MDLVEQELICCVCLDLFETPVLLPCSHNLCKKCARGLSNTSGVTRRIFDCPKCRHEVRLLPGLGLDGLPENLTLKSIIAVVKKQKQDSTKKDGLVKLCLKHDRMQDYYCRSCRLVICELCLKDGHLGFGHIVSETREVLEEEQDKANMCGTELKRVVDSLEAQHQNIVKKKEKITHFERNVQKSLDYDFQQLILTVNMTKLSLTCGLQKLLKDCKDSTRQEESRCQELIRETAQLGKMLEASENARNIEKKIQKLEKFVMKETGLMAFKLGNHTYDVQEDSVPVLKLTGVDEVKKAIESIQWVRTDNCEEKAKECDDGLESSKSAKLDSELEVPKAVDVAIVATPSMCRVTDEHEAKCHNARSSSNAAVCAAGNEHQGPSSADDSLKLQQWEMTSVLPYQGASATDNSLKSQQWETTSVLPHQGAASLFGLCCRSRRSGSSTLSHTKTSCSSNTAKIPVLPKDALSTGLQCLSLTHPKKDKHCTKLKQCEMEKRLSALNHQKTLTYYSTGVCKKHMPRNCDDSTDEQGPSATDKNGNNNDDTVCPVTESNRPLFTVASSHDNRAEIFQALCKSSCNHSNHSEKPFFEFADSRVPPLPLASCKPDPSKMTPLSITTDFENLPRDIASPSDTGAISPKTPLFQPVTSQEDATATPPSNQLFSFGSTKDGDVASLNRFQHHNAINHVESSPFRATEFFKSISDPGSPSTNRGHQLVATYASPLSPDESGNSEGESPPFVVSTGKPPLHKSKSAGARPAGSSTSTSPKALFTIGLSMSPKTAKRHTIKRATRSLNNKKQ